MRQTFFTLSAFFAFTLLSSFALQQEEYGKAGYYADSLHGRKTASGEVYDKYEFTCAHKTLPFGTKVRITRLDNKKSVVCKVNDRGPFVEGYVTDMSRAAAEAIGLIKDGVTRVKLEVVGASVARVGAEMDGRTKTVLPIQYSNDLQPVGRRTVVSNRLTTDLYSVDIQKSRKEGFGVQLSTLNDADNVLPVLKKIQQEWPLKAMVLVEHDEAYDKNIYKVIIGPFSDAKTAAVQQKVAAKKGYKGCFVVDMGGM